MKSVADYPIKFPQPSRFKAHLACDLWNGRYEPGCAVVVVDDDGEDWTAVAAAPARVEGDVAVLDLVDHDTPVWLCRVWPEVMNLGSRNTLDADMYDRSPGVPG